MSWCIYRTVYAQHTSDGHDRRETSVKRRMELSTYGRHHVHEEIVKGMPPHWGVGCNGYIMFLERNRYLLSKLTLFGVPSPVVTLFGVPLHQSTCLGELYIFGFFMKNSFPRSPCIGILRFQGLKSSKIFWPRRGDASRPAWPRIWGGSTPRYMM